MKTGRPLQQDSQCAKILAVLEAHWGDWVTMPDLVVASGSYNVHTRIDELRKRGCVIENHTDLTLRPHISKYRLVTKF